MAASQPAWREPPTDARLHRARQREAARQIRDGELVVPLQCHRCESTSVVNHDESEDWLACVHCGHHTPKDKARKDRHRRILVILREGRDHG